MCTELLLTPEEIFCLGKLYDGNYLNYAYIAAMEHVGNNKASFLEKTKELLVEKGIIQKNLLGEVSVNDDIKSFLMPLYFCSFCSSIDILSEVKKEKSIQYFFYYYENRFLMTRFIGKKVQIALTTIEEIEEFIHKLFDKKEKEENIFNENDIERIIVIKNMKVTGLSTVNIYFDCSTGVFERNEVQDMVLIENEQFCETVKNILKGDNKFGV